MKALLTASVFCALLAVQPAWAQQPSMTPSRAEPVPTSNPPTDPFKDGGRPESHGGTVHAPQVGTAQPGSVSLSPEMKQTVQDLARTAVTAQQYGNLASKRHTSGAVHELGDQMVVTNSRINRALTALDPNLQNTELMPAQERGTFDNLARNADEVQFGISVAQWVAQSYPQTIGALERLGQTSELRELAASAIPDLKAQLSDAQMILQSASATPNGQQPATTGTVTDPKVKSD
jgi:hypothetical protein